MSRDVAGVSEGRLDTSAHVCTWVDVLLIGRRGWRSLRRGDAEAGSAVRVLWRPSQPCSGMRTQLRLSGTRPRASSGRFGTCTQQSAVRGEGGSVTPGRIIEHVFV